MKTEKEVEYKSMVTKDKYDQLSMYFRQVAEASEPYTQTNYFFDDKNRTFDANKLTLRIRFKKGAWQLTAKIPAGNKGEVFVTAEEWNLSITEADANTFIETGIPVHLPFLNELSERTGLTFKTPVCLGSLATRRTDFSFYQDIISLDENVFNETVDYELEWETTNHKFVSSQLLFLGVKAGNGKGKRKRFLQTLKKDV